MRAQAIRCIFHVPWRGGTQWCSKNVRGFGLLLGVARRHCGGFRSASHRQYLGWPLKR